MSFKERIANRIAGNDLVRQGYRDMLHANIAVKTAEAEYLLERSDGDFSYIPWEEFEQDLVDVFKAPPNLRFMTKEIVADYMEGREKLIKGTQLITESLKEKRKTND